MHLPQSETWHRVMRLAMASITLSLLAASGAYAQLVRRTDALRFTRELRCQQAKSKQASPLLIPGLPSWGGFASLAGAAGHHALPIRDHIAGSAHVNLEASQLGDCGSTWEGYADLVIGDAGAGGAAIELRSPGLSFGGVAGNRHLGTIGLFGGAEATARPRYEPAISYGRFVFAGALARVHVPVGLPLPNGRTANVRLNLSASAQADWAWQDESRIGGRDVLPHFAGMISLPILRWNIMGPGYAYERLAGGASHGPLTRHVVALTLASSEAATFRGTLRWSLERPADGGSFREIAFALHTKSFPLF